MVISVFPTSAFALTNADGSEYTEGKEYTYGTASFKNPSDIWCDTSDTTEILRLAGDSSTGSENGYAYGNYLVKATPSGIPENTSAFQAFLYAGETVVTPKVVCKIYGASSESAIQEINIDERSGDSSYTQKLSNVTFGDVTKTTGTDSNGSYIQLTSEIKYESGSDKATCGNGANQDVHFQISFKYEGKTYTQYAYSHTEYILHPNGVQRYFNKYGAADVATWVGGKKWARLSYVVQLVGANMKPGYASSTANKTRAYINGFNTSSVSDDDKSNYAVSGMNESGPQSSGTFSMTTGNNANINNSLLYYGDSNRNIADDPQYVTTFSTSNTDGNRTLTTVWVDKAQDYLGYAGESTVKSSNSNLTNNLNMRVTLKVGTIRSFWYAFFNMFQLNSNAAGTKGYTSTGADRNFSGTAGDITTVNTNQWIADTNGKSRADGAKSLPNTHTTSAGNGGFVNDEDVISTGNKGWVQIKLGGVGPTNSQAGNSDCWSIFFDIFGKGLQGTESRTDISGFDSGSRVYVPANMSVRFRVYDTSALRQLITAIDNGTAGDSIKTIGYGGLYGSGTTQTTANITKSKGMNPQESMYGDGWAEFKAAYDKARQLIAAFDVDTAFHSFLGVDKEVDSNGNATNTAGLEQSAIDTAMANLVSRYNDLSFQKNGTITIHHKMKVTNSDGSVTEVTVVPDEVYYGLDASGNPTKTESAAATKFKTGLTFTLNPLAELQGYKATSEAVSGYAGFYESSNDTTYGITKLYGDDGEVISNADGSYTFYYVADDRTLVVQKNKGSSSTEAPFVTATVKTGTIPDFGTIRTDIGAREHYNLEGLYEKEDFSSAKINESTWTMPPTKTTNLYVKWTPKPVKLHINAYDDSGNALTLSSGEYSEGVTPTETDGTLGAVSFNQISDPTASADGYKFVSFYSDKACTNAISWPIEADYKVSEDDVYTIVEGTGDYNTIEIYAKFANINNKISFEPNGGTMPTGYETNQITFETGKEIAYPVPTRAGYTFNGWVTADGKPINAENVSGATGSWTEVDTTAEAGLKPSGGTITMSSTVGFIAYASWTANDVVIHFDIGVKDTSTLINYKESLYQDRTVKADQLSSILDAPTTPRRYGYNFSYWKLSDGRRFVFGTSKYPTQNDKGKSYFTLTAVWTQSSTTAHTDLVSYVKYAGTENIVDDQHTKAKNAACGDTVSIKFTVNGNFYSGSQGYIFGYNKDFYEEIADINVFEANEDNTFIKATGSELTVVRAFSTSVTGMLENKDPETGSTNVEYIQVYVEPDVSKMEKKVTQSMADQSYLIEIRLKIKDANTIAADRGSVWLATETYRTSSNIMGDTFISYTQSAQSFKNVTTDTVTLDQDKIVSTVTVDKTLTPANTTITLTLPTDSEGNTLGNFPDSQQSTTMTFTGREGAEILSYVDNGTTVAGFPTPVREGYTVKEWVLVEDGTLNENDKWTEGYYATADQNGKTYQAVWTPNKYVYTYYYDADMETKLYTRDVEYDQLNSTIKEATLAAKYTVSVELVGWIPVGEEAKKENCFDFTTGTVTGDMDFYAYTIPAQKNVNIYYYIYNSTTGEYTTKTAANYYTLNAKNQGNIGIELRVGQTLKIVKEIPEDKDKESNVVYLTYDQVTGLRESSLGNYVCYDGQATPTVSIPAKNVVQKISVYYIGKDTAETFSTVGTNTGINYTPYTMTSANTKKYVTATYNGDTYTVTPSTKNGITVYTWTVTGHYNEAFDVSKLTADVTAPFGFTISGWRKGTAAATTANQVFTGGTWSPYYESATINLKYVDKDGKTVLSPSGVSASALYSTGSVSTDDIDAVKAACTSVQGYEIDGFYAVKYNAETATYEKVSDTVYSGSAAIYMGAIEENGFTVTTTENTDTGTTTTTYDLYLMPHYSAIKYDIKYIAVYSDDKTGSDTTDLEPTGSAVLNGTYKVGDGVVIEDVEGYSIRKTGGVTAWYTSADLTGEAIANGTEATMTSEEGATYYAVYEPNEYDVIFDANGGNFGTDTTTAVKVTYNTQITAPAENPTWEGHEFKGWATTKTANKAVTSFPTLETTEQVTYYAVWSYSVTFNANGGKLVENGKDVDSIKTTYSYGDTITKPADPTRTGYTFNSWNATVATTMPAENLVYTAQWDINSYTINFGENKEYGTITADYNTDITKEVEAAVKAAEDSKPGYTLKGWTATDLTKTDDKYLMPALGVNGTEITLTPVFEAVTYTVKFDHNGGTGATTETSIKYDAELTLPTLTPANEGKTGYSFAGWSKNSAATVADAGYEADKTTVANANLTKTNDDTVTLYAVWTANEYFIHFKSESTDTTDFATIQKNFGESVTEELAKVSAPEKTGYTFLGWSETAGSATADYETAADINLTTMPYNGKTYFAVWKINTWTVTYMVDGNVHEEVKNVAYNSVKSTIDAPSKDGYDFAKWTSSDVTFDDEGKFTMPNNDITITAEWTAHKYTVSIDLNGATSRDQGIELEKSVEYAPGVTVTLPVAETNFARADYRFTGWYPTAEDAANKTNALTVTDNEYTVNAYSENGTTINIYAGWEEDYYTLTFNPNGGTFSSEVETDDNGNYSTQVIYNKDITGKAPKAPTKDGYDFDGWYNGSQKLSDYTGMTRSDLTFTATWKAHTYENGVYFIQPDESNLANDYTDILSYNDKNTYKKADTSEWIVTATTGEGLSDYPQDEPKVGDWTFMYWVVSDTAPEYKYNEDTDDYVYVDNAGAKYTVSGSYVDKEGVTHQVTSLANFVMPEIDINSSLYLWAVYYRDDVELNVATTSEADIVKEEHEDLNITGFIYNVGERQKQSDIENQLVVEGDGSLSLTPSKYDIYGTGAKVELVDNRQNKNQIVETYYIIVFGDVTGTAMLHATDMGVLDKMATIEESQRTWGINTDVAKFSDAEKVRKLCYEKAGDADNDGDIDTTDAEIVEGVYFYDYDLTYDKAKGQYVATPV